MTIAAGNVINDLLMSLLFSLKDIETISLPDIYMMTYVTTLRGPVFPVTSRHTSSFISVSERDTVFPTQHNA